MKPQEQGDSPKKSQQSDQFYYTGESVRPSQEGIDMMQKVDERVMLEEIIKSKSIEFAEWIAAKGATRGLQRWSDRYGNYLADNTMQLYKLFKKDTSHV